MNRLILIIILLEITTNPLKIYSQDFTWVERSKMPFTARNGSAVVCNDKIYFMGGSGSLVKNYEYYPETDSWTKKRDMLTMGWNFALGTINGKIYAIGGDQWRNRNEVYDTQSDSWQTLTSMPTPRQHIKCGIVNNKIYILGGLEQGTAAMGSPSKEWDGKAVVSAKNEMYDPETDSWIELAPLPVPMHSPNAYIAVVNKLIYVIGGMGGDTSIWTGINIVQVYDPETDTWKVKKELPFPSCTGAATVDGILYAIGAALDGNAQIAEYNAPKDEWEIIGNLPVVRRQAGIVSYQNSIFIIGGNGSDNYNPCSNVYEISFLPKEIDYFGQTPPGDPATKNIIPIDTTYLETSPENIIDFQGKKCLWGNALLKNILYKDCIIEFDIWTDGERSYPGIMFRLQPDGTGEHMYIRPHASGRDLATQYTPAFFGTSCWQLYHGEGYNRKYNITPNTWIHFKAVVINNKAKLFLDNSETPVLECNLVHHSNSGKISFNTTREHTYFTNLKVEKINPGEEQALPVLYASENKEWEISEVQNINVFQRTTHPPYTQLKKAGFEKVDSDIHGMLNISKYRKLQGSENCIYAKKIIYSEKKETVKIAFGYSDAIKIFLNEQLIYSGNYSYKSRGEWFNGNIGLYDTLYLNLEKGLNELFLIVKDNMGGCGIIFKPEKELLTLNISENEIENIWSTQKTDLRPETTIYDPQRKVIYYSNFDNEFSTHGKPTGYLTKISTDGKILEQRWIDSIYAPCGMDIHNDKLYVTERKTLSIISLKEGKVIQRYDYPEDMVFANDVAVDDKGFAYITNSVREQGVTDIFRLEGNKIKPWLSCDELLRLNAIFYDDGYLLVGNSESRKLQKINIETKEIQSVACLGRGIIDGIKKNEKGNYLVSLWEGELYEVGKNGEVKHLFSSRYEYNIADFEYIPESGMLVFPTFMEKNIMCFQIKK